MSIAYGFLAVLAGGVLAFALVAWRRHATDRHKRAYFTAVMLLAGGQFIGALPRALGVMDRGLLLSATVANATLGIVGAVAMWRAWKVLKANQRAARRARR